MNTLGLETPNTESCPLHYHKGYNHRHGEISLPITSYGPYLISVAILADVPSDPA